MKLTKSFLQKIIKEELEKFAESRTEEDLEENKEDLDEEKEELEEYEIGDIRSSELTRAEEERKERDRERARTRSRYTSSGGYPQSYGGGGSSDDGEQPYDKVVRTGRSSSGRYSFEESKQKKSRKRRKK